MTNKNLPQIKVSFVGLKGCGKTSMINTIVNNSFIADRKSTDNVTSYQKLWNINRDEQTLVPKQVILELEDYFHVEQSSEDPEDPRVKQLSLLLEEVGLPPAERRQINNLLQESQDSQWFTNNFKSDLADWDKKFQYHPLQRFQRDLRSIRAAYIFVHDAADITNIESVYRFIAKIVKKEEEFIAKGFTKSWTKKIILLNKCDSLEVNKSQVLSTLMAIERVQPNLRHFSVTKVQDKDSNAQYFTRLFERKETSENKGQMGVIFTSAMAMYNVKTAINSLMQVITSDTASFVDESSKFEGSGQADDQKDDRDVVPDYKDDDDDEGAIDNDNQFQAEKDDQFNDGNQIGEDFGSNSDEEEEKDKAYGLDGNEKMKE